MSQIIELNMDTTDYYVRLHTPLVQWSHGHIFRITGLQHATNVEIHFSLNDIQGEAVNVPCSVMDGIIDVKIPQMIMEGPVKNAGSFYKAYLFLFECEPDFGETIRKIEFTIRKRPKPTDYECTEEEVLRYWNLEERIKDLENSRTETYDEDLLKVAIKPTTEETEFVCIKDSADFSILDFRVNGKTEQFSGTIQSENGEEVTVPSPDYPQEIVNAGKYNEATGRYEIECVVGNKNLWDTEYASDVNNWIPSTTQVGYSDLPVYVGTGESVTVSCKDTLTTGLGIYAGVVLTEDGSIQKWIYHSSNSNLIDQVFTIKPKGEYIWIRCFAASVINGVFMQYIGNNLQLEFGSTATDYAPHESQTFTLTSPVPLTKWDKLVKRDGVWRWSIYGVKSVFTGKEAYVDYVDSNNCVTVQKKHKKDSVIIFTHGLYSTNSEEADVRWANDTYMMFKLHRYGVSTYSDFVELVKTKYDNGTPFTVFFEDQTERAFHQLPDEEQILLNNLKTYYGVTNICNDQGCPMQVSYVADTKMYIDNKIGSIQKSGGVWLSDLSWVSESSGDSDNPTRKDRSCGDNTITLWDGTQEVTYEKGIGSHAPSTIEYDIGGHGYKKFLFDYGIDRETVSENDYASIVFKVYLDDTLVFASQEMKQATVKGHEEIDVTGISILKLVMEQGANTWHDHGDWAGAKLTR